MQSFYIMISGTTMHYSSGGTGKPVVFVHGIPSSSYMWRYVMPSLARHHRCIAVDLIGMGKSGKPPIPYSIEDHIYYFEAFMETLDLSPVTLVMHGWGTIIGFAYAQRHPEKISGLAFSEGYIKLPSSVKETSLLVQELARPMFKFSPPELKKLIVEDNYIIEKVLPSMSLQKISPTDWEYYRAPFGDVKSRQALWQFTTEQPFLNPHSPARKLVEQYAPWLHRTPIRKLMMYSVPGFLVSMETVKWAKENLANITLADVGLELHALPETCATEMADVLADWV